ncbi:hypothetical protein GCM10007323_10180 [Lactobacillus apis]|nr:hypothetical protein GCM10007323_10180 [Lactobacillus apis]
MSYLFSDDYSLHDINIANFVMHNVINFSGMFYQLCELKKPDISSINIVGSSIDSIRKILSVMTTIINADHVPGYALKENPSPFTGAYNDTERSIDLVYVKNPEVPASIQSSTVIID